MQPTPAQPKGPEIVPNPSRAATPTNPNPRPRMRHIPKRSCTPKNRWISAIDSGTMAMRMPVTEELIHRSPYEMTEKGMTNSANAKAKIAALCFPKDRKAPRRHAIGSKIRVPSVTRPKATTTGESSCTDSLIKKYGSPQMIPIAPKAPHPPQLTPTPFLTLELRLMPSTNAIRDWLAFGAEYPRATTRRRLPSRRRTLFRDH